MNRRLVILAGGVSSRMKQSTKSGLDEHLSKDANSKAKAMIGLGDGNRPFLDYLLMNAQLAGYRDVVIVVNDQDSDIREYYTKENRRREFPDLFLTFALQVIPEGRTKPLGTADALLCALKKRPDWRDYCFTVCNSDNLYSVRALSLLAGAGSWNALVDYDRSALDFPPSRIAAFAVLQKDRKGSLLNIVEKPTEAQINAACDGNGRVGVSMNLFRFSFRDIFPCLESVPLNRIRQEKELPSAVKLLIDRNPGAVKTIPVSEHLPDLTSKDDLPVVKQHLEREFVRFMAVGP